MGNMTVFYLFIYLRAEDISPQGKNMQIYLKHKVEEAHSCKELSRQSGENPTDFNDVFISIFYRY